METEDLISFLYGCVFLTEVKRALNRHYINRLRFLRVTQVIFFPPRKVWRLHLTLVFWRWEKSILTVKVKQTKASFWIQRLTVRSWCSNSWWQLAYTKTGDNVEGALWLATQTPNILSYSPQSNVHRVCAWKSYSCCKNKWVKTIL